MGKLTCPKKDSHLVSVHTYRNSPIGWCLHQPKLTAIAGRLTGNVYNNIEKIME